MVDSFMIATLGLHSGSTIKVYSLSIYNKISGITYIYESAGCSLDETTVPRISGTYDHA